MCSASVTPSNDMLNGFLGASADFGPAATTGFARGVRLAGRGAAGGATGALKSAAWRVDVSSRAAFHCATSLRNWSFIPFACLSASRWVSSWSCWSSPGWRLIGIVLAVDGAVDGRGADGGHLGSGVAQVYLVRG